MKNEPQVLALCGSPRRGGNTELLVDACLEGLEKDRISGKKIRLNELNIRPCQECGGCLKTGSCIVSDDMQILYPLIREAKGIIVSSPIFFGSLTAQTKIIIDRSQCFWVAKYILNAPIFAAKAKVPGVFLSVCGMDRYRFFQNAQQIIKIWFTILNIDYTSELLFPAIDKKGGILNHPSAIEKAKLIGKWLTNLIANTEKE